MAIEIRKIVGKLAGETAIYGTSTILARFINFFFISLYTYILTPADYGVLTEFMAYIAILQVVLTLGLETGCFRFANREGYDPDKVFSGALISVSAVSSLFLLLMIVFGQNLSLRMGYEGYSLLYVYIGLIMAFDAFTAILFAKLRNERKAWKFALFKTMKILTETVTNLVMFLWFPSYAADHPDIWILNLVPPVPDFSYPVFAIFVSGIVSMLLFIPDLFRFRFGSDRRTVTAMLRYSLPLMIAGLPGVLNDFLDRVLFRYFNVDDTLWRADLGIYQAGVKVAVIMSLFVQMFRFASEPFFFSKAEDKDFRKVYAAVMEYFTAFCMLVFLGVVFYIDIIQYIVGRDFRAGMDIVPIMLFAYMLLGMLFNVSMWYKLSDRSSFAIYITLAGLVVTAVINILFLPEYSYHAAAWGHLASYMTMLLISVFFGRKYYPVPYRWDRILAVVGFGLAVYGISLLIPGTMAPVLLYGLKTVLIVVYVSAYYLFAKKSSIKYGLR